MADVDIKLDDDNKDITVQPDGKNDEVVVESASSRPEKSELKVEDAITELKSRLESEKNARLQAEARARDAENVATNAKIEVNDTNMHLLSGAIESLKREQSILKADYKSALATGNYGQAAEIQEQIAITATNMLKLQDGKVALENQPKPEPKNTYSSNDPVEQFVAKMSPQSAAWIRAHPEYVTNPDLNQMMIGAHSIAVGKRIPVDSPEYFSFIENTLGMSPQAAETIQEASGGRSTTPSVSPAAAPVSRAASTNGASRPNVVRLSEAEREIADMLGMDYKEYAKNKVELQKAGRLN